MSEQCQSIRIDMKFVKDRIAKIQKDSKVAKGAQRQLNDELVERLQIELARLTRDLETSEATTDPLPLKDPGVWGVEITQGLPGYEMVAGKDTLTRVFVGRPQPVVATSHSNSTTNAMHFDLPGSSNPLGESRLDFAILRVRGPRGIDIEIPGQMATGIFTNYSQRYTEDDNVNFFIDGSQLPYVGIYQFDARFYRNGLLVGTRSIGQQEFHPTKDLRLLFVVDGGPDGTWVMPPAAWNTLFEALKFVNRNFPVRAGIGPLDGNRAAGLRYTIAPAPFELDFPNWELLRQMRQDFNDSQAANNRPDRADHLISVRVQQSHEGQLGGVGLEWPEQVSGVTLNVNPPADRFFGTLISHEIGHNFGLEHTLNPDISTLNGIDLLGRRSIPEPASIMYRYYDHRPNPDSLFLADDWNLIRQRLLTRDSSGP